MAFGAGDTIEGVSTSGRVIRSGEYVGIHRDSHHGTEAAIVRWDGDEHDSIVSVDRIQPAAEDEPTELELHQQYAADMAAIWATWHAGRMSEEDAMVAIRDRKIELDDALKETN